MQLNPPTALFLPSRFYTRLRTTFTWLLFGLLPLFLGGIFLEKIFPVAGGIHLQSLIPYVLVIAVTAWIVGTFTSGSWFLVSPDGLIFQDYFGQKTILWEEITAVDIKRDTRMLVMNGIMTRNNITYLVLTRKTGKPLRLPVSHLGHPEVLVTLVRAFFEKTSPTSILEHFPEPLRNVTSPRPSYVRIALILVFISTIISWSRFN